MRIQQLTIEEAIKSLNSSPNGLTEKEVALRLKEYGPNLIEEVKEKNTLVLFLHQFFSFFAVILWIAAGLAFFAEYSSSDSSMATLGYAIIGVIFINGIFSFWQEYKAEKTFESLKKLLPAKVKVLRDDNTLEVLTSELVPGDVILLEAGDNIPADCRLIEVFNIRVNNATVTGESLPLARCTEPSSEESLINSKNILLAGTYVVSGEAKALVIATGLHTEFGKIAHLTQVSREETYPLQEELRHLSRVIAILAIVIGVVFFFIGRIFNIPLKEDVIFAIGIIIALVPEGLLPTVTLSLAFASQRMAKRNALVRHLPAVETLGSATVICTDKTGTLTQNRMSVNKIFINDQIYSIDELNNQKEVISANHFFFEVAYLCQNLKESKKDNKKVYLGDPMETALVEMAEKVFPSIPDFPRIDEVPFDTDRKRFSSLHKTSGGLILYTKGALETVLPLCENVQIGQNKEPMSDKIREKFSQVEETLADKGLRILAFAYKPVSDNYDREHLEENMTLLGLVGLEDPPRPEVKDAIQKCREADIKVIIVTGDHPKTARAIGMEIGLIQSDNPKIIMGEQLRKLSNIQLRILLDSKEIIFARIGADQKKLIVDALKQKKQIVAVTGDGVNDAPALKSANIGVAMGITGTDVAKEAADIVLLDDNFANIVQAIEEGRAVYDNIRKFLTYILTSNMPELVPYLAYVLFKIPLPLTIIQILSIDLGTDTFPALALGSDKPEPGIMAQPPRSSKERLVNYSILIRAFLFLGVLESLAAMSCFFFVLHQGGWQYGESLTRSNYLYLQATTATLSTIVVMQIMNLFLCRTRKLSIFTKRFLDNKLIFYGILFEILIILLIDYTGIGNKIFGTTPISWQIWLFPIPFALLMLLLEELRKLITSKIKK